MKLTEDPEKQTLPGSKAAFRLLGSDGEPLLLLCCPPLRLHSPASAIILAPYLHRISAIGPAAVGRRTPAPGWARTEGLASGGPGALHCEASSGGATAATLAARGSGDSPQSAPAAPAET
jgi:hypothetical protein